MYSLFIRPPDQSVASTTKILDKVGTMTYPSLTLVCIDFIVLKKHFNF